jgi:putative transcriptional regulator
MAKVPLDPGERRPGTGPQQDRNAGFLTGHILISMPAMADPRFAQSVIYLCAHTSDGAMGIVLNRPVLRPAFTELLAQLSVEPNPPRRIVPMCAGGPVEAGRGFMLHTADWTDESSLLVTDLIAVTASLGVLRLVAAGDGPRECLLALGYAGWGPGQLDREIQANAWLSVDPDEMIVFDNEYATKWRRALAKLNVDPLLLSDMAGHA